MRWAPGPSVRATGDTLANLGKKNGIYLARFRFQGKEYKKSLTTSVRRDAEAAMHRVADALHRLAINILAVPAGVDPGDFIVSGGTLTAPTPAAPARVVPTLDDLVRQSTEHLGHRAESNRSTVRGHRRSILKKLAGIRRGLRRAPAEGIGPWEGSAVSSYVLRGGAVGAERLRLLARVLWPSTEALRRR